MFINTHPHIYLQNQIHWLDPSGYHYMLPSFSHHWSFLLLLRFTCHFFERAPRHCACSHAGLDRTFRPGGKCYHLGVRIAYSNVGTVGLKHGRTTLFRMWTNHCLECWGPGFLKPVRFLKFRTIVSTVFVLNGWKIRWWFILRINIHWHFFMVWRLFAARGKFCNLPKMGYAHLWSKSEKIWKHTFTGSLWKCREMRLIYLSICLSIYVSIYLSIYLSI